MRDTSLASYNQLTNLSDKQQSVLIVIHGNPNCTDLEISKQLGWAINRVVPRRYELEKAGWIKSSGYKLQNGRKVHTWRIAQK